MGNILKMSDMALKKEFVSISEVYLSWKKKPVHEKKEKKEPKQPEKRKNEKKDKNAKKKKTQK